MSDRDLIELAMRLAQRIETEAVGPNSIADEAACQTSDTVDPSQQNSIQPPPLPTPPARAGLTPASPAKEKKTADELAAMILADMSEVGGCPKRGLFYQTPAEKFAECVAAIG